MPDSGERGEKPSILVAEDEAAPRTMLRYNLEKEGFCIEEAESGREALTKIAAAPPDLVVALRRMPSRAPPSAIFMPPWSTRE